MLSKKGAIILVLICTILLAIGQIAMKKGSAGASFNADILSNYSLVFGYLLYLTAGLLLLIALRYGELIILFPIVTLSYIWVILLSFYFFNESFTLLKISGIFSIMIGVILIGVSKNAH